MPIFQVYFNGHLVLTSIDIYFIDSIVNNFLSHTTEHELMIEKTGGGPWSWGTFTAKEWRNGREWNGEWNPIYIYYAT